MEMRVAVMGLESCLAVSSGLCACQMLITNSQTLWRSPTTNAGVCLGSSPHSPAQHQILWRRNEVVFPASQIPQFPGHPPPPLWVIPLIVGWEWKQKFCFGNLAKCSSGSQQSWWDWKDEASPESLVLCWTSQVPASSPCVNLPLFCTLTTWKTLRAASNSCNIPRCDLFPSWNDGMVAGSELGSLGGNGSLVWNIRIILDCKRTLGSWSPTSNPALPSPPLNYVPKCLTNTSSNLLQELGSSCFPGQPAPVPDNPFGENICPKIHPKPACESF